LEQNPSKTKNSKPQVEYESALPALTIDYEKYAHLLDDPDLSEDQKREFIETIWNIVMMFVDMGFNVHPTQQAQNACGKDQKNHTKTPLSASNALQSRDKTRINKFTGAASPEYELAAEGSDS